MGCTVVSPAVGDLACMGELRLNHISRVLQHLPEDGAPGCPVSVPDVPPVRWCKSLSKATACRGKGTTWGCPLIFSALVRFMSSDGIDHNPAFRSRSTHRIVRRLPGR